MSSDKSSDKNGSSSGVTLHPKDVHLPREKLPQDLQKLVDNEESLLDQLYDGT